ncbi:MAG: RNA 2',3'-cyclic phosphodiesterase [Nocardioidaceae bacterium]
MRLFAAVVPPPEARAHLADSLAPVRRSPRGLRWTSPDLWHATLVFVPAIGDEALPDLVHRLGDVIAGHRVPAMRIAGAGAFPQARRARVVWVGVHEAGETGAPSDALVRLAGHVRQAAAPHALEDGREFHPHITIGRLRAPTNVRGVLEELAAYRGPAWDARSVRLVRSRLGAGADGSPRYETLEDFSLTGDS